MLTKTLAMSNTPSKAGPSSKPVTYAEVNEMEQEINCTSTPLPLPRTRVVLHLIAEARRPDQIIYAVVANPTTAQEHQHNDRMRQLDDERSNPASPGVCVCLVKEPYDASKAWFAQGHECLDHAKQWFHFFHCTRVKVEDYPVLQQELKWCKCDACNYFVRCFKNGLEDSV